MERALVRIPTALLACALAACSSGATAPSDSATSGPPIALFVGDSYTEGVGLAEPRIERWSALVSISRGWTEVNASCNGSGYTRQGLLCGTTYIERLPSVADLDAQVVVIWGGVNDTGAAPDDATAAATRTIAAYADAFPDAELVVISAMYFSSPEPAAVTAINAALPTAVTRESGTWIDLGPLLADDPSLLGTDGLHPNTAGHRAIAEAVLAALAERD